jgi:hypothetical protein
MTDEDLYGLLCLEPADRIAVTSRLALLVDVEAEATALVLCTVCRSESSEHGVPRPASDLNVPG